MRASLIFFLGLALAGTARPEASADKAKAKAPVRRDLPVKAPAPTPAVKDRRITVPLDPVMVTGMSQFRVLDVSGSDVTSSVAEKNTMGIIDSLRLKPNEPYLVPAEKSGTAPASPSASASFPGWVVMAVTRPGTPGAELFVGIPFFQIETTPLIWDEQKNRYVSRLIVGIEPHPKSRVQTARFAPQIISLTANDQTAIEPAGPIAISQSGQAGYRRDVWVSRQQPGGMATITAHSKLGDAWVSTTVGDPVSWGLLTLAATGGWLGGMARGLRSPPGQRRRWGSWTVTALVVGLLVAAATWLGMNANLVPRAISQNPTGVFVIAAILGYAGGTLIDWMIPVSEESRMDPTQLA